MRTQYFRCDREDSNREMKHYKTCWQMSIKPRSLGTFVDETTFYQSESSVLSKKKKEWVLCLSLLLIWRTSGYPTKPHQRQLTANLIREVCGYCRRHNNNNNNNADAEKSFRWKGMAVGLQKLRSTSHSQVALLRARVPHSEKSSPHYGLWITGCPTATTMDSNIGSNEQRSRK